jgi:hypothetical protein
MQGMTLGLGETDGPRMQRCAQRAPTALGSQVDDACMLVERCKAQRFCHRSSENGGELQLIMSWSRVVHTTTRPTRPSVAGSNGHLSPPSTSARHAAFFSALAKLRRAKVSIASPNGDR